MISCNRAEIRRTRELAINDVSIASIPDGSYTGSYAYGGFAYSVRCIVSEGRLDKVKVLQNRNTKHAKDAELVIRRVVEKQKVDVDAVSGATATSKALLKAVEKALTKGAAKTND